MKKIKSLFLLLVVFSMLLSVVSCSKSDAGADYYGGDLTRLQGSDGHYWSSTPNDAYSAYRLSFDSGRHRTGGYFRDRGFSVRPVAE